MIETYKAIKEENQLKGRQEDKYKGEGTRRKNEERYDRSVCNCQTKALKLALLMITPKMTT
jgi:hypothetical protein